MANMTNVGVPQAANRAFVALAVEAGIEQTIQSLVVLAADLRSLLELLKDALANDNPELAEALNTGTLMAILDYMRRKGDAPVLMVKDLPTVIDADGPASVVAAWDGGVTGQVNITFAESGDGHTSYEVYLDGVYQKTGSNEASAGFINDSLADVPAGAHTVRVLFVTNAGKLTRFGPVADLAA